ncbi:MAG: AAA family ATPase [Bacteroidales bacterium]|nr:AAA family ATPase [Bacteroidales bacterium]
MENLFFPVYNEAYFGMFQMEKDQNGEYVLYEIYQDYQNNVDKPLQQIFYGAPGTGKSDAIKRLTADGGRFTKDFTFRTTFHPDSDYSTFVGAYKPIWSDEKEKIIYEFRPQAFLKAYVAAWTNPDKQVALVVEEINRGNCAQIFGDIFQLLDREANGLSKYPIEADIDMQKFLYDALNGKIDEDWAGTIPDNDTAEINACYSKHYNDAFDKIRDGKILTLPKNLSILATMNTSDQSLFPMDSAFKRRWDWIYQPIVEGVNKETGNRLGWKIKIDDYKPIDWWAFIDRINKVIFDLTSSEDKQLGYFFCMPEREGETTISAERFVEKVVFYLWNDVFKDYSYEPECCNKKDKKDEKVKYSDFYTIDGKDIEKGVLAYFINQLKTKDGEVDHMAKKSKDVEDAGNDSGAGMGEESGAQDNSIDALPQGSLF